MAERICPTCGASNPEDAEFCRVCDTYFGWDGTSEPPSGSTATATATATTATATTATATDPPTTASGTTGGATSTGDGAPTATEERRAQVPVVTLLTVGDVVVTPAAPGVVRVTVKNPSRLVDGMRVHAAAPPPWLTVEHDDVNLMPGETGAVDVRLTVRPGAFVEAQRFALELLIRSELDPTLAASVTVQVGVPRTGPAPTLTAQPVLVRLQDRGEAVVQLTFDNRSANYPRRYRLSEQDAEGVVTAVFFPPVVDVPAGGSVEVGARMSAPRPEPGQEATRQVTVTAEDDEGTVTTTVTLVQRTSAAPARQPVALRLEPSQLSAEGTQAVPFDVLVDNRSGTQPATVALSGRDPQHRVALSFGDERPTVPAGAVLTVHAMVRGAAPPAGQSVARAFSVVANDGVGEVEAVGVLEVTSEAAPITTARLRVQPSTLVTSQRRGGFAVDVDNRAGGQPLRVRLTASDEFGTARLTLTPSEVTVPAGQVGRVSLGVDSPMPASGASTTRRLHVTAADAVGSVEGEATLTQTSPDRRPAAKRWLVVLGALLVIAGAALAALPLLDAALRTSSGDLNDAESSGFATAAVVATSALVVLLALIMLMGLNGKGRAIRASAILVVLGGVAIAVGQTRSSVLDESLVAVVLVVAGAVLAFIGGVLARPRSG